MNLDEGIALAESLAPHRVFFTHLSHDFGHAATQRELPPNVFLAYDGLKLSL
jgi:phosphoribosyl 1,2-cyclic phosphate phosphodiesterase